MEWKSELSTMNK